MNNTVDNVTLDIIKDSLIAVGEEIFYVLGRTSMSPIIYEVLDYASGISDADGNLLTQGNGACGFIGLLSPMIIDTIKKHGKKNMYEGDVFIVNDPYMGGGSHCSDVGMVMPIFNNGNIIAFVANKAHWTEVGGMAPGSFTTDSTDIFQEGLRFSCLKLMDKGVINQSLVELIQSNVRFPEMSIGDMWGQISALKTGSKRVNEVCDKYGTENVKASMIRLLDQGEIIARNSLKKLPKGTFECADYMDNDGYGNPVHVKVKITITDDEFIADFTGSSPQVASPLNTGYSSLCAGVKIVYMSIINPEINVNDGVFRPLKVIAEDGSIFSCNKPAPTSTYFESMLYATDIVWHALADTFPKELTAGHLLSVCAVILSGVHQDTKENFLIVEPSGGGWGAGSTKDGEVGQFCVGDGETYNVPIEVAETRYGIQVEEYSLNNDGAGAGEHRGGSGAIRTYKAMSDGQSFTASFGRNKSKVWGMRDGLDGSTNEFTFYRKDGSIEGPFGIVARVSMNTGDVVKLKTATGGGCGNPLLRPSDKVSEDVKNGYYTIDQAKEIYGVIINNKFEIVEETKERKNLKI